jgi:hypothetical protein
MQSSASLRDRSAAAVAAEVAAGNTEGDTQYAGQWAAQRAWDLAATPGWAEKWDSAEAAGITDPGASDAVITDADLLSRVQQLLVVYPLTDLSPPEPPPPVDLTPAEVDA